ncbi:MAG TPA: DUF3108 domain-containing protein [Burkholderiales bacterium]|nr:DUF3108 domain-containing protein [Burkholderiales bacterium]
MINARLGAWRRLALMGALSGAVHAAIVSFGHIDLPEKPRELPPLAVRIVAVPPVVAPPAASAPRMQRQHRIAHASVLKPSVASAPSAFAPAAETPAPQPEDTASAEEPAISAASPAPPEPLVIATAPASTFAPEPPPLRVLPRRGRITYELVYGRDRFPIGRTISNWEMSETRYQIASRSETSGLVDLIRSQHRTYLSRGSLTRDGLRPEKFLMSRNRGRGTEEAQAEFDWENASLRLGSAAAQHNENLPARTQDILSFIFQLALDPPPPGRFRQSLTNGSKLEAYEVDVLPEETIETQIGALRALPVKQVRKTGRESLELWLAVEYRYLPVRIRFFNREGEPQGEQIVTEIRLGD